MNETIPIVLDGGDPLAAMLTLPGAGIRRSRGVVICSPLGHQNICSYRPLRALGEHLADQGWPVLRFDWPGCGDSADLPTGSAGLPSWTDAAQRAVAALRSHTGVDAVALVGLRVGATLGMLATATEQAVTDLVLLAPFATGGAYLRELRMFEVAAQRTRAPATPPPGLPAGSIEASGFLVTREQVAGLEAVELSGIEHHALPGRRVLVVSAQPERGVRALVDSLTAALPDVTHVVSPELASAWDDTSFSAFPASCSAIVSTWLADHDPERPAATARGSHGPALLVADGVREETISLDGSGGRLVGVTCEPLGADGPAPADAWVLFLNAGGVRRSGPNRLWTTYARAWARSGLPSLRLDVSGVGDSDGDRVADETPGLDVGRFYTTDAADDVRSALAWLEARGARRVTSVGLCSGAYWSFHAALAGDNVSSIGLVNPAVLFWDERQPFLQAVSHAWRILRRPALWPLIFRKSTVTAAGDVVRGAGLKLRGAANSDSGRADVVDAFVRLEQDGKPVHAVFSGGDLGLLYLERHLGPDYRAQLELAGVTLDVIDGPDHTFRPLWSHDLLRGSLEVHLRRVGFMHGTQASEVTALTQRS